MSSCVATFKIKIILVVTKFKTIKKCINLLKKEKLRKKDKESFMENNYKNRVLIGGLILLAIFSLVTGYYAFTLKEQYNILNNNNYTEAFSNLVNYVNSVENYLAKSMISKSSEHATETLTQIWRDSNLAMVYLSRIPLEDQGISQTGKFLNQVSDYSYSLQIKTIN